MTDAPHPIPTGHRELVGRNERLARALRENLHRRKEQARARGPLAADPKPADKASGEPPA